MGLPPALALKQCAQWSPKLHLNRKRRARCRIVLEVAAWGPSGGLLAADSQSSGEISLRGDIGFLPVTRSSPFLCLPWGPSQSPGNVHKEQLWPGGRALVSPPPLPQLERVCSYEAALLTLPDGYPVGWRCFALKLLCREDR